MSLFDRYFLVLTGRVPESGAGVVATSEFKSGMFTLGWPLDPPTTNAGKVESDVCVSATSIIRSDRSLA